MYANERFYRTPVAPGTPNVSSVAMVDTHRVVLRFFAKGGMTSLAVSMTPDEAHALISQLRSAVLTLEDDTDEEGGAE